MKNNKIQYITRTGLSIALIILSQLIGKILPSGLIILGPFNFNQLITGSLVNMILIITTLNTGLISGISSGIFSSIIAMFLNIGPIFPQLVPLIALSNIILTTATYFLFKTFSTQREIKNQKSNSKSSKEFLYLLICICIASILKFIFLNFTVPISFNLIKNITDMQRKLLSIMFSWPQLITSLTGGISACSIYYILKHNNN